MDKYFVVLNIDDERLEAVLTKLREAEQTIRDCYDELREMGVVSISREKKKDTDSCN